MLKKYVSQPILKNCTVEHVWTGRAGLVKLGPQAGWAEIFRSRGMDRTGRVCDFDGRAATLQQPIELMSSE
jgi:hypothetical protein